MENKRFTVLLDLDSTVYDLLIPTLDWVNYHNHLNLTPKDITTWHWFKDLRYSPMEYWSMPGTFEKLKPFPGAIDAIKAVESMGIQQIFVSAVVSKAACWEKFQAIDRDFPSIGRERAFLVGSGKSFGGQKGLLKGDVLVDDGPHYLEDFHKNNGGLTVSADLHGAPYTKLYTKPTDIMTNWEQYASIISDLRNGHGWEENVG